MLLSSSLLFSREQCHGCCLELKTESQTDALTTLLRFVKLHQGLWRDFHTGWERKGKAASRQRSCFLCPNYETTLLLGALAYLLR